jgi:hypothetical protein
VKQPKNELHIVEEMGRWYADVSSSQSVGEPACIANAKSELSVYKLSAKRLQKLLNECNRKIKKLEGRAK